MPELFGNDAPPEIPKQSRIPVGLKVVTSKFVKEISGALSNGGQEGTSEGISDGGKEGSSDGCRSKR